jgi:hypothetical protein
MKSNQKYKCHKYNASKKIFLYFRYKEKKIQGLNNNLTGRLYYKQKETIQAGNLEATTQTNKQGQLMKKMTRKKFSQKFNNTKASYHFVGT